MLLVASLVTAGALVGMGSHVSRPVAGAARYAGGEYCSFSYSGELTGRGHPTTVTVRTAAINAPRGTNYWGPYRMPEDAAAVKNLAALPGGIVMAQYCWEG